MIAGCVNGTRDADLAGNVVNVRADGVQFSDSEVPVLFHRSRLAWES